MKNFKTLLQRHIDAAIARENVANNATVEKAKSNYRLAPLGRKREFERKFFEEKRLQLESELGNV